MFRGDKPPPRSAARNHCASCTVFLEKKVLDGVVREALNRRGFSFGYEVPVHAEMGRLSLMHTDEEMASALCAGSPAPCELLDRLGIPLDR
ncbi:hypothetical protein NL676_010287 [Syzygium grande]|nr:hypothetical protein NL676_010287 [Syzygium grande]